MDNLLDINVMAHKAMLITLSISQWTARKKDKRVGGEVATSKGVDASVGDYYKSLVDPKALELVKKIASRARDRHYQLTLPWSDNGPRILSSELYMEYMQEMNDYKRQFDCAVSAILDHYPQLRAEAVSMLGPMFDDTEYPSPEALVCKFGFGIDVMPLPSATDFRCQLDEAVVEKIQEDIESRLKETARGAITEAYRRCQELVQRYIDRLEEPDSIIRDSMLEQAKELADIIPRMNFINDPELDQLAARIKDDLCKHNIEHLRHVPTARRETYEAAKQISNDFAAVFGG